MKSFYFFLAVWYTESMKYNYVSIYNKNAAFYNARPKAKKALIVTNTLLTYGFLLAYVALWAFGIWKEKFSTTDNVTVFVVPMLTLIAVSAVRALLSRPRPYSPSGAGIEPLVKKNKDMDSCPSRHLACATVIAVTFLPFFPIAGAVLLLLCPILAYTRFALGLHYPSDLLAGMGVGGALGALVFIL